MSMPTRIAGTPRGRARRPLPGEALRVDEPELPQLLAPAERLADRRRHRLGALRVAADGRGARGLVERRVRGGDDRSAARHRLGDRHPEALEPRRVDHRRGAAVEPRELLVGDPSERARRRAGRARAARPTRAAGDDQLEPGVLEKAECLDQRAEVLPGLERRDGEEVGLLTPGVGPVGRVLGADPGVGHDDPLAWEAERGGGVVGGERRVREHHAARLGRVLVLAGVHRAGAAGDPLAGSGAGRDRGSSSRGGPAR